ncbi:hypothetical protein B0H17DRAFT_1132722 [Mycena rosella]|uniref:Uncharacterized protein n=1 Tax=Mycena rosella TaxID=1033263 RepID=A0AAD7GG30_MYCRO|nr:hypothetical protein B0H17DRAFT_1132722 [Mycena rosella]
MLSTNGQNAIKCASEIGDVWSVKAARGMTGAMGGCDGAATRRWARRSSCAANPEKPEAVQFTVFGGGNFEERVAKRRQNAAKHVLSCDLRKRNFYVREPFDHSFTQVAPKFLRGPVGIGYTEWVLCAASPAKDVPGNFKFAIPSP